jgi:hypothetical protein
MANLPNLKLPKYYDDNNILVPVVECARITYKSVADKGQPEKEHTIECYVAGTSTVFPIRIYFIAKPDCIQKTDGGLFIAIGCGDEIPQDVTIKYEKLEDLREPQKPAIEKWEKRAEELDCTGYVSDGKCFVAAATFGSPDDLTVMQLRRLRDTRLRKSYAGRQFIMIYQLVGPHAARLVNNYPVSKRLIAPCLKSIACFWDERAG